MVKLHSDKQFLPSTESVTRILAAYGLPLTRYQLATSGLENLTLIVEADEEKYVLRVYRQDKKSDEEIERELDFMASLRRGGLPLPTFCTTPQGETLLTLALNGQTWQCLLMDYASGSHATSYPPTLVRELARFQATMHIIGECYARTHHLASEKRRLSNTKLANEVLSAHAMEKVTPSVREFLRRAVDFEVELAPLLPYGMSHFDYDADNVLSDETGHVTAILDFDDAHCLPLVVCLGYTLWDIAVSSEDTSDLLALYLRTYQEMRSLSRAELDLLPRIMLFRHYAVTLCIRTLGELEPQAWQTALSDETRIANLGVLV